MTSASTLRGSSVASRSCIQKLILTRTALYANGQLAGGMDFVGNGGALCGPFLLGVLLCTITLGLGHLLCVE